MNVERPEKAHVSLIGKKEGHPLREMMGPLGVDMAIRQAVQQCWMSIPEEHRSVEKVEQEVLRIVQRVIRDFKEDAQAFGFYPPGEKPE